MKRYFIFFIGILTVSLSNAQGPLSCNPIAMPSEVCQDEQVLLFALASGGNGNYTFSWTSTPPGFFSELPDPVVFPVQTTTYHLTVDDNSETCQSDVTVIVNPRPIPNAGPDQTLPWGILTTLQGSASGGSGNYIYHWEPANQLVDPNVQNPQTVILMATTLFDLHVTDLVTGCECSYTDDVIIIISGGPLGVAAMAVPEAICIYEPVQLSAFASGGSGDYAYYWTSDPPGFTSTLQNPIASPEITQTFFVTVSDGYNTVNDSVTVSVHPVPGIYSLSNGGFICPNGTGIELMLNGSDLNVTYELFRNSITTGINVSGTGGPISFGYLNQVGEYNALGLNDGCQVQMNNSAMISYPNFKDEICMINVDSITGKNFVIWNKTANNAISSYNIYQESTSGGNYTLIGNVVHDAPGIFTDNSANPLQRSFSYTITTIDTCGTESAMSSIHTTMHLSINAGINSYNLIWTPYAGIEYQTYYIYRRQLPDSFQVIDSVPNSIHSYTDINPPQGVLDYVIEIRNDNGCNPGKGQNQYSSVFSNIISTNVGIDVNENRYGFIMASPNPFSESTSLFYYVGNEDYVIIRVFDIFGQLIAELINESKSKGEHEVIWNAEGLSKGMYLYQMTTKSQSYAGKMVLN